MVLGIFGEVRGYEGVQLFLGEVLEIAHAQARALLGERALEEIAHFPRVAEVAALAALHDLGNGDLTVLGRYEYPRLLAHLVENRSHFRLRKILEDEVIGHAAL